MRQLNAVILSLMMLLLGGVAHGMVCRDVLNADLQPQDIFESRWSSLRENDQRNLMLMMLGSNGQPTVSRKDIFEKGEMELGLPLGDGRTLILSYQADSRQSNTYKLGEIGIMDQAAERDKLDGRPLDANTLRLSTKAMDKLRETLGSNLLDRPDILFPSVIEGRLMDLFKRTENWIEQIRPDELSNLKVGDREFRRLNILGQQRRFVEFVLKTLPKKILWKAVEWGLMFAVITTASSPAGAPRPLPAHEVQRPIVEQQIAQVAQADLVAIVRQSTTIRDAEKLAIYEALLRNNSNAAVTMNSPVLSAGHTDIRTTSGRDIWVLNRETGRLFLTVIYQSQSGAGVQLTSPVYIEIPRDVAPYTYQSIVQLFSETGRN